MIADEDRIEMVKLQDQMRRDEIEGINELNLYYPLNIVIK